MDKVIYRFANKEEIQDLTELSSVIYKKPVSIEYFKWFYDYFDNISNSVAVAETERKIVALQPFTLLSLKTPDGERKVAFLTGVGTHPDYRRRGIFSSLIEFTTNALYNRGDIQFVYTFPNEFSFPGFLKLTGWQLFGELNLYIKPLNLFSTSKGFIKSLKKGLAASERSEINRNFLYWNNIASLYMEKDEFFIINKFSSEFDNFWNRLKNNYNICLKRDSIYLNWRYIDNPQRDRYLILGYRIDKEIKGYIVLKKEILFNCTSGLIVDILSADNKVADSLIKEALRIFKGENLTISGFAGIPSKDINIALKKNGYFMVPRRFLPKHFWLVYKPLQNNSFNSLKNCYLTWGDTDLL